MSFTSNVGEKNGVYLNVKREKNGCNIKLTIRCSVCGREFTRTNTVLQRLDMSCCVCERFIRGEKYKNNWRGAKEIDINRNFSRCKRSFELHLRERLRSQPDLRFDDFEKIWDVVGEKPQDTPFSRWILRRKCGGRKNPNFTVDNMEWFAVTTSKAVKMAESLSTDSHRSCAKRAAKAKLASSEDAYLSAIQRRIRKIRGESEYAEMVGKKKKSFRILDVIRTVSGRASRYTFRMRCEYCGKEVIRSAARVMNDCRPCRCRSSAGRNARNSSVCSGSSLMRKKYMRFNEHKMTLDQLLLLQATLSEYTINCGTQEYILSRLEAAFLGMDLNA